MKVIYEKVVVEASDSLNGVFTVGWFCYQLSDPSILNVIITILGIIIKML